MADKRLIKVPLTEIRTNDEEILGSLYPHKGKIYRWVKNSGATDLTQAAVCLTVNTSVHANIGSRVIAPSGAAPSTANGANVLAAAGVPSTTIYASGSATGDHGWILCKGITKVSMNQSATAADQYVGSLAIASQALDAAWGRPISPIGTPSTAVKESIASKKVVLMVLNPTTGAATAASFIVDVQCL